MYGGFLKYDPVTPRRRAVARTFAAYARYRDAGPRFSYIDRDGRLGRDSVCGETQREALDRRAAKMREIARRGAPIVQRRTVAQLLAR